MGKARTFDMLTPVIAPGETHEDVVNVDFPFRLLALVAHEGDSEERGERLGSRSFGDCGDAFDIVSVRIGDDGGSASAAIGKRLKGSVPVPVINLGVANGKRIATKLTITVRNISKVARACHYDVAGEELEVT